MGKFNQTKKTPSTKTVNLAGGEAYSQTSEVELVSILLTSFVDDQFYRKAGDTLNRLATLLKSVDPKFAAKAAIYARNEFGMRSISHVLAVELAKYASGKDWAKKFYQEIVRRPDDMTEILSFYFSKNKKGATLPNALKGGFAKAFEKFDAYQLAKYRGEGKETSLVDVANIVHPAYVERNGTVEVNKADYLQTLNASLKNAVKRKNSERISELKSLIKTVESSKKNTYPINAIEALMIGALKNTDTWEAKLSDAGKKAESEEDKMNLKADAWKTLVSTKKIAYFALLRNLRNIIEQAPSSIDNACEMLTDEKLIKKSLVLPFRYISAVDEIKKLSSTKEVKKVLVALNKAVDIACSNVPKFDGETLVVLDVSGSMTDGEGKPAKIGSLFASILVKSNYCDFMTFDGKARYVTINPADSTLTVAEGMRFPGGSTNFKAIFETANKAYDRIIILSDMQGWVGYNAPTAQFSAYKQRYNCNPYVYSFDLAGHGTMQFPEKGSKVCMVAGFSEKTFDVMTTCEQDKNALVNTIKNSIDL